MPKRSPERFVAELALAIDETVHSSRGLRHNEWRLMSTVVAECGWHRRSEARMRHLDGLLRSRGIYSAPPVTDQRVRSDDKVIFTNRPVDFLRAKEFADEARLSEFVREYHRELFSGTSLEGLSFVDREYPIDVGSKTHSVDMLFTDSVGSDVAIEFKVAGAKVEDVDQLCRYLDRFIQENLPVRGILITAESRLSVDDQLVRQAIRQSEHEIEWYTYTLPMPLAKVDIE